MTKSDLDLWTPTHRPFNSANNANFQRLMYWSGVYTQGGSYEANEVVLDDGWLMIANKLTTERAAPQPFGAEFPVADLSPDAPPVLVDQSQTTTQLIYGNRYTFTEGEFLRGVSYYIPDSTEGMTIAIWMKKDPTGTPELQVLVPEFTIKTTDQDKWVTFPLGKIIIPPGTVFEVLAVMQPTTGSSTFTWEWVYIRGNGDPASGEAKHQAGGDIDQIRFHEEDSGATDRTTDLDNIGPGSTISMASSGFIWDVLTASKLGSIYTFIVDPASRALAATSDFTFVYYSTLAIKYVRDDSYWSTMSNVLGVISLTGDPDDATTNEHLYGIDIIVQQAAISLDWDVMAFSG